MTFHRQLAAALLSAILCLQAHAQSQGPTPLHRTRLILKDGSYQLVTSYKVIGDRVTYTSAERANEPEEIPLKLVDLDATQRYEQQHSPEAIAAREARALGSQDTARPGNIDPELLKEEADRAALTPLVAPDLHLPEQDSVLALDTFQDTPELIPLIQTDGDLNRSTAHNVLKTTINPFASQHQILTLKGERAAVQLHVAIPVLYLRIGDDSGIAPSGTALTVDTHGASSSGGGAPSIPTGGAASSRYVIVRTDGRTDSRLIVSFNTSILGTQTQQEDLVETTSEPLPGGHWVKLTATQPLAFGEYALIEVLSERAINSGVWDFGIHPTAPENRDALKPEAKRPFSLDRRRPQ